MIGFSKVKNNEVRIPRKKQAHPRNFFGRERAFYKFPLPEGYRRLRFVCTADKLRMEAAVGSTNQLLLSANRRYFSEDRGAPRQLQTLSRQSYAYGHLPGR